MQPPMLYPAIAGCCPVGEYTMLVAPRLNARMRLLGALLAVLKGEAAATRGGRPWKCCSPSFVSMTRFARYRGWPMPVGSLGLAGGSFGRLLMSIAWNWAPTSW